MAARPGILVLFFVITAILCIMQEHDVMGRQHSCHFARPIPKADKTKTIRKCIKDNCNENFPFHVGRLDGTCQNDANSEEGDNYKCCTSCKHSPGNNNCEQSYPFPGSLKLPPDYEGFVTRLCMNSCDETFPFHVKRLDDACLEDPNNEYGEKYTCCSTC